MNSMQFSGLSQLVVNENKPASHSVSVSSHCCEKAKIAGAALGALAALEGADKVGGAGIACARATIGGVSIEESSALADSSYIGEAFDQGRWALLKKGLFAYGIKDDLRAKFVEIAARTTFADLKQLAAHFNQEVIDWSICEEEEIGERLILALAFGEIEEQSVGTIFNYMAAVKGNLEGDRKKLREISLFLKDGSQNPNAVELLKNLLRADDVLVAQIIEEMQKYPLSERRLFYFKDPIIKGATARIEERLARYEEFIKEGAKEEMKKGYEDYQQAIKELAKYPITHRIYQTNRHFFNRTKNYQVISPVGLVQAYIGLMHRLEEVDQLRIKVRVLPGSVNNQLEQVDVDTVDVVVGAPFLEQKYNQADGYNARGVYYYVHDIYHVLVKLSIGGEYRRLIIQMAQAFKEMDPFNQNEELQILKNVIYDMEIIGELFEKEEFTEYLSICVLKSLIEKIRLSKSHKKMSIEKIIEDQITAVDSRGKVFYQLLIEVLSHIKKEKISNLYDPADLS